MNFHPVIVLGWGGLFTVAVLLSCWEMVSIRRLSGLRCAIACVAVAAGLVAIAWQWLRGGHMTLAWFHLDRFAAFFGIIILVVTTFILLQLQGRGAGKESRTSYALVLLSALGAIIAVYATDLIAIYLGLSLASLSFVVCLGLDSDQWQAGEIQLKHYLAAGLGLVFFVLGVGLFYWGTGQTSLEGIQGVLAGRPLDPCSALGLVFVLASLATMMMWVPFHFSHVDVSEGGPAPAVTYLSVLSKLTALGVFLRLLSQWWEQVGIPWHQLLLGVSLSMMVVANPQALCQRNIKRRLAFGTMAQIAFLFIGLAAAGQTERLEPSAFSAVAFYLVAYVVMTTGAFAVLAVMGKHDNEAAELSDYVGLSERKPWLAAVFTLFLLSLSGLPPTMGFVAKYFLLKSAIHADQTFLYVIAMLSWVVSAVYYFDIIAAMYFKAPREKTPLFTGYPLLVVIFSCALLTLYWGLFPSHVLLIVQESVRTLLF